MRLRNGTFLTLLLFCLCAFLSLSWYAALSGQKGEPPPRRRPLRPAPGAPEPLPSSPHLFAFGINEIPWSGLAEGGEWLPDPRLRVALRTGLCLRLSHARGGRSHWQVKDLWSSHRGAETQGHRGSCSQVYPENLVQALGQAGTVLLRQVRRYSQGIHTPAPSTAVLCSSSAPVGAAPWGPSASSMASGPRVSL